MPVSPAIRLRCCHPSPSRVPALLCTPPTPAPHVCLLLLLLLLLLQVQNRLLDPVWQPALKPDRMLRVLQCTRLLSRDSTLRQQFVQYGAVQVGV